MNKTRWTKMLSAILMVICLGCLCYPSSAVHAYYTDDDIQTAGGFRYLKQGNKVTITGCVSDTNEVIQIPDYIDACRVTRVRGMSELKKLKTLYIPGAVTVVEGSAFRECTSLEEVYFMYWPKEEYGDNSGVESIGELAFAGCTSIQAVYLTQNVEYIGHAAFSDCTSLKKVNMSEKIDTIDTEAFRNCTSLTSLPLTSNVRYIRQNAFRGCTGLKSIQLGGNLKEIGDFAFADCTGLESVRVSGSKLTQVGTGVFSGCTNLTTATVSAFAVPGSLFSGCSSLASVTMTDAVGSIGENAFEDCTALTTIEIPDSVTEIGSMAFARSGLTSVILPKGVERIESGAFNNCSDLRSITIANPECAIAEHAGTICNELGIDPGFTIKNRMDGTIYGYAGSTAQAYAEKYQYPFTVIGSEVIVPTQEMTTEPLPTETENTSGTKTDLTETVPQTTLPSVLRAGDADLSGSIDIMDVIRVNKYLLGAAPLSTAAKAVADVNDDGAVDEIDSLAILIYVVNLITSFSDL